MNRREFIAMAACVTATACPHAVAAWPSSGQGSKDKDGSNGWPSGKGNTNNSGQKDSVAGAGWPSTSKRGTDEDASPEGFSLQRGCTLLGAQQKAFQQQFKLVEQTGWPYIDQAFSLETRVLGDVTGYRPGFAFFDDEQGPNAFATSDGFLGSPHGSVCFGINLLKMEQAQQSHAWEGAAVFVMAHEWAHITEFNEGATGPTVAMELFADYLAGWYLGMKTTLGSRFDARGAARSVFSKGDYEFNSQAHHGTPHQRLQAATAGWDLASKGVLSYGQAFQFGRGSFGL